MRIHVKEFMINNKFTSVIKIVRRNSNGLYVTFIQEGDSTVLNIYFSTYAQTLVHENQAIVKGFFNDLEIEFEENNSDFNNIKFVSKNEPYVNNKTRVINAKNEELSPSSYLQNLETKNSLAYITKSNYKRILKKIDLNNISNIEGEVYKKPIYFLGKWETNYLLLMQSLLKEPEKFAIEMYQPIVNKDTYTYVYESEQQPSYHVNPKCEKLTSKFKNFEVPFEVKARIRENGGDEELVKLEVQKFRNWFKKYFELLQTEPEGFLKKLDIDWNIQRTVIEVEKDNSGIESFENYNLSQLEQEIDKIIGEAGKFFTSNPDKQSIIRRFQKLTFLAYKRDVISNNDTQLNDKELKDFLQEYDLKFKKPIKNLLIEYYRVKYNPELSFEGHILEKLNFKECLICNGTNNLDYVIDLTLAAKNSDSSEELPF